MVGWLCFTSHQQGGHSESAPDLLSLAKDVKLSFTLLPPGIKPQPVAWQSNSLPLHHASSTKGFYHHEIYKYCHRITQF